jgi:hypothetical protein
LKEKVVECDFEEVQTHRDNETDVVINIPKVEVQLSF